jgi:hypothetical protein
LLCSIARLDIDHFDPVSDECAKMVSGWVD